MIVDCVTIWIVSVLHTIWNEGLIMKIKAAVVDKVNDPFVIKDDIDLAEMTPTDLQMADCKI